MRIPWRRVAVITAVAVPIVAVVGVVWAATRDLSRYQARLTEQVRKVTGRELAARVPLTVRLGSEPAMVAEGVTLSNAAWGSRPDLARVRRLTLFLDPFSLFLGEVKIGRILLEGADILVERNEVGDANLEMLPPPDGSGPHPGDNRSLRLRTVAAFPWISHRRDSRFRPDRVRGGGPSAGRRRDSECHAEVAGAEPDPAGRWTVRRGAGRADGPHRDRGLLQRLDGRTSRQYRPAGRIRRRQDLGSRAASMPRARRCRSIQKAPTSRCWDLTFVCPCRRAAPT